MPIASYERVENVTVWDARYSNNNKSNNNNNNKA